MATMVSYFCIFTMYVVIGQRYYPIPHRWNPIIISVLITSIIIGVFYYLNLSDSVRFAASLFTLLSFPLIALKIKLIQRDEILWVWNFFRQRILIRS